MRERPAPKQRATPYPGRRASGTRALAAAAFLAALVLLPSAPARAQQCGQWVCTANGELTTSDRLGIGVLQPTDRLTIDGDIRLSSGREIVFDDDGQIRSLDDNHRILFRRSENKMELREYGSIVFSPGSTGGQETARAVLTAAGRLGIGTQDPQERLHVVGSGRFGGAQGHLRVGHDSANAILDNMGSGHLLINWYGTGDVAIGTRPGNKRDVAVGGTLTVQGHDLVFGTGDGRPRGAKTRQRALVHGTVGVGSRFDDSLILNYAGDFEGGVQINGPRLIVGGEHVASGAHTDYRLAVDGKVAAREIVVTDGPEWADDVFHEGYALMPLAAVRDFIGRHRHLPAVPSADDVRRHGINLGEMDSILLRKVEELTLYVLEIQAENRALSAELSTLRERLHGGDAAGR